MLKPTSYGHESLDNADHHDGFIYIYHHHIHFQLGNSVKSRDGEEERCSGQKGNSREHSCMDRIGYMLEGRRNEWRC